MQSFRLVTGLEARRWTVILAVLCVAAQLQLCRGQDDPDRCGKDFNNALCYPGYGYCCSQYGYCGTTDAYCGIGCQSTCKVKSSKRSKRSNTTVYIVTPIAVVSALVTLLTTVVLCRRRRKLRLRRLPYEDLDSKTQGFDEQIPWKNRNNHGLKLAFETVNLVTNGFSTELGRGAFGVVYKGTLKDGTDVAVKKLIDNARGLKDFEVEVNTLGSINHRNLVALIGFCLHGKQSFLIYEYVTNGSLDKWIFEKEKADKDFVLPWTTRVKIVKGMAQGLAYLHEDLQIGRRIIHLDIKPENILLDEDFMPKVADFGLAKLVGSKRVTETLASGGTFGYMAPEVHVGAVTWRMDVYSFGIVMLEVLSGRRHVDRSPPKDIVSAADDLYLPAWAIRKVGLGEEQDVIDPLLRDGEFDSKVAEKLILVALLCLQRDPEQRPQMSRVLRIIEGDTITLKLPPTLQFELEMTETLVRFCLTDRPQTQESSAINLDFSSSRLPAYTSSRSLEIEIESPRSTT